MILYRDDIRVVCVTTHTHNLPQSALPTVLVLSMVDLNYVFIDDYEGDYNRYVYIMANFYLISDTSTHTQTSFAYLGL